MDYRTSLSVRATHGQKVPWSCTRKAFGAKHSTFGHRLFIANPQLLDKTPPLFPQLARGAPYSEATPRMAMSFAKRVRQEEKKEKEIGPSLRLGAQSLGDWLFVTSFANPAETEN